MAAMCRFGSKSRHRAVRLLGLGPTRCGERAEHKVTTATWSRRPPSILNPFAVDSRLVSRYLTRILYYSFELL